MLVAKGILLIITMYVIIGIVFGAFFVIAGLSRIDHAAAGKGAPWSFRIMVFPGIVALWPVLLRMSMQSRRRSLDRKS